MTRLHKLLIIAGLLLLAIPVMAATNSSYGRGHHHPPTTTTTVPSTTTTTQGTTTTTRATTTTTTPTTTTTTAPGGLGAPPGYSTKIFDDAFSGTTLNTNNWNTYITSRAANGWPWNSNGSGGSGDNAGGYNAEYYEPSQVSVNNGLSLTAVRGSTQSGYQWTSGGVSTYGHFQFNGGYVQYKAKMTAGNGMWPALWMLPGPGGTNGDDNEIDSFEGGALGNGVNPNNNYAWHLITPSGKLGNTTNVGTDVTAGYHIYGLAWVPGQSITWYFDGNQVGKITSAQLPIPNEPMELIIDLAVANSNAAGWHTVYASNT